MVARLHSKKFQAPAVAWQESHSPTVPHQDNSQHDLLQENFQQQRILQQESLQGLTAQSSYSVAQLSQNVAEKKSQSLTSGGRSAADHSSGKAATVVAAVTPKAAMTSNTNSPFHPARIPIASDGDHMPTQRRLFDDLDASDVGSSLSGYFSDHGLVFPEITKSNFNKVRDVLKPITRSKPFRAVAQLDREAPVLVWLQLIREAKALSGLSDQQIAERAGIKSRHTVAKALRVEPSVGLYDFCEVMNVLGLEIAQLFPMRKVKRPEPHRWPRGQYHSPEETERKHHQLARADAVRSGRKKKRHWG